MLKIKIPYRSAPVRIDWKCSKCGKDNTTIRFLNGNTVKDVEENFIALQDETDNSRFKYLNIGIGCFCSCGESEK